MGFVLDDALYTVDFSATKLAGLEVGLREMSTRDLLALSGIAESVGEKSASKDAEAVAEALGQFAGFIATWNLEDKAGNPEPISGETLLRYPLSRFVMPLINACVSALSGVSEDLGKDFGSGRPSPVESIPMEVL